ncbi:FO synthase subunit 2 [Synechococcus elongatus PCC 7943]|uniref:7,8-didemethyl-8-hydroxy-5-deazariboflavin synthase subunit CofH n=1 Tax=Synechococcus elongatus TaxID=32046 RepID=UPI00204BD2F0|nr:7,8-didemethyl-8-hydroxy-5-deazariboflavin synthase subunit CofH [Synechococcus elongatus]UOW70478.1 FO synthase subunit 2 [Synechococcus elongatus PCC 7943]
MIDSATVAAILASVLDGKPLEPEAATVLLKARDRSLRQQIQAAANQLRSRQVGDRVSYVINRNLNFTNICEQHCNFCAFRRDADQDGAFWLDASILLEKGAAAVAAGATEFCLQGGLNPAAKRNGRSLDFYVELTASLKQAFPQIHLHAFSPQEIQFIAREDGLSFREVLMALRSAGVGSLPGTAAEVLDDSVRRILCPEKLDSATWKTIIQTAHQVGLPTTSTLLSGHLETPSQQAQHLEQLRQLQQAAIAGETPARITEFILLPFVGELAPAPLRKRVKRDQPDLSDALLVMAVARLYLGDWIANHQPSWVKLGLAGATQALDWGCNDLGGTLMEEHITSMTGAQGGTAQTVEQLEAAIAAAGRQPYQRDTLYRPVAVEAVHAG